MFPMGLTIPTPGGGDEGDGGGSGSGFPLASDTDVGGFRLTNLADPVDSQDAATLQEVNDQIATRQPLDADLTALAGAGNSATLVATSAAYTSTKDTKLGGIETGADVTDAANVAAAGAAMASGATDIEITDATKGVILRAPGGARWRLTVGNDGAITTTVVP